MLGFKGAGVPKRLISPSFGAEMARKMPCSQFHLALLDALGACCCSLAPHCDPGRSPELDAAVQILAPWRFARLPRLTYHYIYYSSFVSLLYYLVYRYDLL